jgi:hypothetical protein
MKSFKVTAIAMAVGSLGMMNQATFAANAELGDIVQIGCTAPGPTGAAVYSIDVPTGVTFVVNQTNAQAIQSGQSCTQALSVIQSAQGSANAGCYNSANSQAGTWIVAGTSESVSVTSTSGGDVTITTSVGGAAPVLVAVPGTGYALQQFTLTCVQ